MYTYLWFVSFFYSNECASVIQNLALYGVSPLALRSSNSEFVSHALAPFEFSPRMHRTRRVLHGEPDSNELAKCTECRRLMLPPSML